MIEGFAEARAFPIGSFIKVRFGGSSYQVAHVVGYTKDGRIKFRAWNAAKGKWMPNFRISVIYPLMAATSGAHLPAPPAIGEAK